MTAKKKVKKAKKSNPFKKVIPLHEFAAFRKWFRGCMNSYDKRYNLVLTGFEAELKLAKVPKKMKPDGFPPLDMVHIKILTMKRPAESPGFYKPIPWDAFMVMGEEG